MKKFAVILCLFICVFLVSSCENKNAVIHNVQNPVPTKVSDLDTKVKSIKEYFSYKGNTKYSYEGKGNEYATYSVFVDYIMGDRVQIRTDNGGTETVSVLEIKDGKLTKLISRNEAYYRENLIQSPTTINEIILKEPLVKGTTWAISNNRKRYISGVDTSITTTLGNFKTIEVTTEGKEEKIIDYYAPNIGLVKSVFESKSNEISSTLSKIENNVKTTQTLEFYYPNIKADKINFVNKKLNFNTNDITKITIEKAYKNLPKGNISEVLNANTKIKSLYLNKDNMVYVDFTKEFVSEMNAGSGYESMILQSITNTLGRYYGVNKVYLTVEGVPYTSGHMVFKKGEALVVNLKNSIELK